LKYSRTVLFSLVSLLVLGLCAQSAHAHLYVAAAVDNWDIAWENDDGIWPGFYGQTTTYYYDGDSAQSADISDNQESVLFGYTPYCPAGSGFRFVWKVSSEPGYDKLRFFINSVEIASISGEVNWQTKTFPAPVGYNTVQWKYTKDYGRSQGADAGWVDHVEIVSGVSPGYSATIWGWDYIYGWQIPVQITMDGVSTGYSTPHTFTGLSGTHKFTVPSTNSAGHPFSEWSTGWTDETIKVTETGTYTARYRAGYCATIRSWCTVEGWTYGLPIIMDGKSTGYTTLHTFPGLTGTHTFTVPSTDALGHKFDVWSTGWVNEWNNIGTGTTITVSSAGMYTARYKLVTTALTVKSPNGGEKWIRGTTHTLTWSSSGSPGAYVKIELMKGGVVNKVISSSTANDGSYSWTISSTQTLGTDYKIRITSTSKPSITDSSNSNFAIVQGTLTVTVPNGGESWKHGTVHTITWSKSGSTGSYVKIELLKGGTVNRVISSSTPNDGSYSWTIPSTQTPGTDYKIRITSTAYSSITDSSNSNFAIIT